MSVSSHVQVPVSSSPCSKQESLGTLICSRPVLRMNNLPRGIHDRHDAAANADTRVHLQFGKTREVLSACLAPASRVDCRNCAIRVAARCSRRSQVPPVEPQLDFLHVKDPENLLVDLVLLEFYGGVPIRLMPPTTGARGEPRILRAAHHRENRIQRVHQSSTKSSTGIISRPCLQDAITR